MFALPVALLLVITVITQAVTSTLRGVYAKKFDMVGKTLWQFNCLQNLACGLMIAVVYAVSGTEFAFGGFSVLLGIALAAVNILSLMATLLSYEAGPYSYTSIIIALSAIIPTFSGMLLFNESISLMQYLGVALMVVCIFLSPASSGSDKNASAKWLLFCAIAFVFSGLVGVIQKIHQNSEFKEQMPALLLTCFAFSTIFSLIMLLFYNRRDKQGKALPPSANVYPVAAGLCFAFPHTINLFLSGKLAAVVFFPVVNLTPTIIAMLAAIVLFKERLTPKRWIGIAIGILSTVFVSGIIKL